MNTTPEAKPTMEITDALTKRGLVRMLLPRREDGIKTEDMWLFEALGGKYTRRHGYTISITAAKQFFRFRKHGVKGRHRVLAADQDRRIFQMADSEAYLTRGQMIKHLDNLEAAK